MFGFSRRARQAQERENALLSLPSGTVNQYDDRSVRELTEETARERLNSQSIRKGWDGKWPCFSGACQIGDDPTTILHDPAELSFAIASRMFTQFGTIFPHTIGKTGLVVLCHPCTERERYWELRNV